MEALELALAEALYWRRRFEDACPDVGMGPFDKTLLDEILARTQVSVSDATRGRILAYVGTRRGRSGL